MTGATPTDRVWGREQPPVDAEQAAAGRKVLPYYRTMAFVTGVFLIFAVVELVLHYATDVSTPGYAAVWTIHGWLFVVYAIVTGLLGMRLRWPLLRLGLVVLAGTIPTMSFFAEHVVTRDTKLAGAQPEPARD